MHPTVSHNSPQPLAPVNALPAGTRVQEFEIKAVIGEGGFGIVYRAWDTLLGREVAIKEYLPVSHATRRTDGHVIASSERQRDSFEKGLRCFVSEARMLARFKHPALVEILRFWEAQGTAYMVMPYYHGRSLHALIQEGFRLKTDAEVEAFLTPLLDGLAQLHRANCFHRDIAADNILMLENGQPLLLDFGAARSMLVDPSDATTVILKPGFAPIEQYSDDPQAAPQGAWTDVYALSAVTYQAVTGIMPTVSVARIIRDPLAPLAQSAPPGFSPVLLAAIDAGLRVMPDERPQSVQAFIDLMRAAPVAGERVLAMEVIVPDEGEEVSAASDDEAEQQAQPVETRKNSAFARAIPVAIRGWQRCRQAARHLWAKLAYHLPPKLTHRRKALLAGASLLVAVLIGVVWGLRPSPPAGHLATQTQTQPTAHTTTSETSANMPYALAGRQEPEAAPTFAEPPAQSPPYAAFDAVQHTPAQTPDSDGFTAALPPIDEDEWVQAPAWTPQGMTDAAATPDSMPNSMPDTTPELAQADADHLDVGGEAGAALHELPATQTPDSGVEDSMVEAVEPTQGTVEIRVEPWGNVFIDGRLAGVTPPQLRIPLNPGLVRIEMKNETHPAKQVLLNIEAGHTYQVSHVFGND